MEKKTPTKEVKKQRTPQEIMDAKKKTMINKALKILKKDQEPQGEKPPKHEVLFIADLIARLPISTSTFYEWFPSESAEMELLKDNIENARVAIKSRLRRKMFNSNNSLGHIALYKLIGTDEERSILNQQDVKISGTGKDGAIQMQQIEPLKVDRRSKDK